MALRGFKLPDRVLAKDTQGSLPSEDSALVLLYGLVATGQIRLRKIDGFRKLAGVISAQARNAA